MVYVVYNGYTTVDWNEYDDLDIAKPIDWWYRVGSISDRNASCCVWIVPGTWNGED